MFIDCKPVKELYDSVDGLSEFLKTLNLTEALSKGAFIAGGFPRAVMQNKRIDLNYFKDGGDIDVFFQCPSAAHAIIQTEYKKHTKLSISISGLAVERKIYNRSYDCQIKIQYVTCLYGMPATIISGFDIVNSMIGFDDQFVYFSSDRKQAENSRQLVLNPNINHSSFLPSRIKKYLKKYKYERLSNESREILNNFAFEFFCKDDKAPISDLLQDPYVNVLLGNSHQKEMNINREEIIKRLLPMLPDEIVLLFMNKAEIQQKDANYRTITVDAALETLRIRNQKRKMLTKQFEVFSD